MVVAASCVASATVFIQLFWLARDLRCDSTGWAGSRRHVLILGSGTGRGSAGGVASYGRKQVLDRVRVDVAGCGRERVHGRSESRGKRAELSRTNLSTGGALAGYLLLVPRQVPNEIAVCILADARANPSQIPIFRPVHT